jgi:putative ABC transport system permease protein
MTGILQDLRYALRQLRKNPGFTAVAVLTLALGIGASTAIFSAVDTILLRPLPYRQPERLALVTESLPAMSSEEFGVSAAEYIDYRDRNRSFSQVASYETAGFNLTGVGKPLRVNAAQISASAFPLLGVSPELGRGFTEEEARSGSGHVVVLSNALWRNEYGGDRNILGKTVKLDEQSYTVVGVMPPSFHFPFDGAPLSEMADLWVPDVFTPDRLAPENRIREFGVGLIGRLKPGVNAEQAQQDISNVANAFMQQYGYTGTTRIKPKVYAFAPHSVVKARPLLILLVLAVGCVLLISCANVANLLLARASQRSREMAVRTTLGAHPARLMRQCLVESVLLSFTGASAGIFLAAELVSGLRRFGPSDLPRLNEISIHPIALLFALAVSVAAAILFGFMPAWRMSHAAPQESLKESTQLGSARGTQRLQNSVATVEIATAVVLLIAGGLLLGSFARLLNSPYGFDPANAFVVRTLFDSARYPDPAKRQAVQKELLERLRQLPGINAVAAASHLPLSDARQIGFRLEHAPADEYHFAENSLVSSGYFHAMGISLIKGRDFTEQDRRGAPPVAIISETLAKQYFRDADPIGQRFQWGDRDLFTIIGVAADVHIAALDAAPPAMIYDSMFQIESGASGRTAFVLRTNGSQPDLFRQVQQQVWAVDKDLPVYNTTTLATLVSESLAQRRFTVLLLGAFGVLALTLAAIGLFGVISYLVTQRTREFGLRIAVGAERVDIYRQVLSRAGVVGLRGCVLGVAGSLLASVFLRASLYHVSPFDTGTIFLVLVLLLSVVLFAAYWPARRAAKVDPMVALRYE